ncbi:MAG TPA: hypothetical protein VMR50_07810 [Myxococcota bacterium]|nr:hypothetical protein [Myxococcota bacterium]
MVDYLAKFWQQVFPKLVLHEDLAVRTGGSLGQAFRKNSPQLAAALNRGLSHYKASNTTWLTVWR